MIIEANKKYRSVSPDIILSTEFPDFLIITGKNGAGKSHFLSAINDRCISVKNTENNEIYTNIIYKLFNEIQIQLNGNSYIDNAQSVLNRLAQNGSNYYGETFQIGETNYQAQVVIDSLKNENGEIESGKINEWLYNESHKVKPLFTNNLANVFREYKVLELENAEKKENSLSESEFISKYGKKPWEELNDMLQGKSGLEFKLKAPTVSDVTASNYILRCVNKFGDEFFIENLSSGEKVLLMVAASIYTGNRNSYNESTLILLDEVDATLHPSMIKNLINLIEDVFVKVYKIPVIMTTHSPTTVALANEESLYEIDTISFTKTLKKVDKNSMLKKLSHGINTLAVTYMSQKNIFVESEYDAETFQSIYNILLQRGKIDNSQNLVFIPSGLNSTKQSGDSNIVKAIIDKLDHPSIYGIIDWDNINESTSRIFVLAQGERYTIENCVLDPVLVISRLLIDNPSFSHEFSLDSSFSIVNDFPQFISNAENLVDIFMKKILSKVKESSELDLEKTSVKYLGGLVLHLPNWYLKYNGHKLEELIKESYPVLKTYHKTNQLKLKMVEIMRLNCDLIPDCFTVLFQGVIND